MSKRNRQPLPLKCPPCPNARFENYQQQSWSVFLIFSKMYVSLWQLKHLTKMTTYLPFSSTKIDAPTFVFCVNVKFFVVERIRVLGGGGGGRGREGESFWRPMFSMAPLLCMWGSLPPAPFERTYLRCVGIPFIFFFFFFYL